MKPRGLLPGRQPNVPLQAEWQQLLGAWRELFSRCERKPTRKRVHALRSLTLRLCVVLEHLLSSAAADSAAAGAFKQWRKRVSKLRRALQPVRDADVYLARLDSLRNSIGAAPESELRATRRNLRRLDKLAGHLERRREAGIEGLRAAFDARGQRLVELCAEMESALAQEISSCARSTAPGALQIYLDTSGKFRHLDSSNLHNFRKRLKPALYLAEFSATADPQAAQLARALRNMHLAIGEWHDWQTLAEEAGSPSSGKARAKDGLLRMLEGLADASFQRALSLCQRTAARSLKMRQSNSLGREASVRQ